jgi:putative methyltransferase
MQAKYDKAGIPVYSELILGLPGETYESFKDGLLKTMRSGNQLFIYFCESLPDTKIAEPAYRRENEILTRKTLLTPVHCKPMDPAEYEDIIVATKTMPMDDWKRCAVLAWMVQLYYSMKVMDRLPEDIMEFCLDEIERKAEIPAYFDRKAEDVIKGLGRCDLINGVYFEPEEAVYLDYFCEKGSDPIEQIIYARKNNFKKKEVTCS